MISGLTSGIAMRVTKKVYTRFTTIRTELLHHLHNLPSVTRLTRRPQFRLVWMMQLGKNKIGRIGCTGVFQHLFQPVQLILIRIGIVRVQTNDSNITIIFIPPMFFISCCSIFRQFEVLKIIGCILFMVTQNRIHRYSIK